jgi:hypothetical protein
VQRGRSGVNAGVDQTQREVGLGARGHCSEILTASRVPGIWSCRFGVTGRAYGDRGFGVDGGRFVGYEDPIRGPLSSSGPLRACRPPSADIHTRLSTMSPPGSSGGADVLRRPLAKAIGQRGEVHG